jgi:hypothetical protein
LALLQEQIAAIKQSAQAPASAAITAPNAATTTETDSVQGAGELTTLGAIPKVIAPGELGQSSLNDNGTAVSTTEKVFVGTNVDDGTVAKLQVHGDVNVPSGSTYLIDGVSIAGTTGFPGSYASVAVTGQTSAISATNIQHASAVLPAGRYLISIYLSCTVSGTGSVSVMTIWHDLASAQSDTVGPVSMAVQGNKARLITEVICDGLNNLTFSTTYTATGTYDLWIDVLRLA